MDNTTFMDTTIAADAAVCGEKYTSDGFIRGELNVVALVVVILFYLVILVVGVLASWRMTGKWNSNNTEDHMVAGRNIGAVVGIFTMTATWVGGGYINGTAEYVFTPGYGLVWTQAPWGYSISLLLGGLLFAKIMRKNEYVTMLDPFQIRYGRVVAALCYIPALLGEIFWTGAILSALGATLTVIVGLNNVWSIIISALIAVFYTLVGGLYSVAYTDVVQLVCIFIGLWLCIPFALTNDAVTAITETAHGPDGWLGADNFPPDENISLFIDSALLLIFGGIPWQVYFQRVLSQKSPVRAQVLSFAAGLGCLIMAVPAVLIGAIAKSTDWNSTDYRISGCIPMPEEDYKLVLPLVMQYLTPTPVAIIGLGAVSAAVMSSADSSVLSASSMFARNIYAPIANAVRSSCGKGEASEREIIWVLRVAILFVAAAATVMAIVVDSIYGLWFLCADLVYVILFPQLILVLYMKDANSYGAFFGFIIGLFFRLISGEPLVSLPPLIEYPWYVPSEDGVGTQYFPFKTLCMLISLVTIILGSYIAKFLFKVCKLPECMDVFGSFYNKEEEKTSFDVIGDDNQNGSANPGFYVARTEL